ncbi:PPM family protein phosphatase [Gammaproteobacteria bacterium]
MKENQPGIRAQRIHGRLAVAAMTDRGNVRASNEDAFLVDKNLGLVVVADGMSGRGEGNMGGAEASALAIKSIYAYLSADTTEAMQPTASDETIFTDNDTAPYPETGRRSRGNLSALDRTKDAIAHANAQIYSVNRACGRADRKGIGTTLAGLYWPSPAEGRTIVFHVGDCRVYRLRDAVLHQLTHDHSASQKWIENGMQGAPPARNLLFRAVGPSASVEAEVSTHVLLPGDVILLCSNGLTTMVSNRDIKTLLHQVVMGLGVEKGTLQLVDMAKANGGKDNITVVLGML